MFDQGTTACPIKILQLQLAWLPFLLQLPAVGLVQYHPSLITRDLTLSQEIGNYEKISLFKEEAK
jgi:hypothetical protein